MMLITNANILPKTFSAVMLSLDSTTKDYAKHTSPTVPYSARRVEAVSKVLSEVVPGCDIEEIVLNSSKCLKFLEATRCLFAQMLTNSSVQACISSFDSMTSL